MQASCPITSINITGNSTLTDINNGLKFFIGENDIAIQTIDEQMKYLNEMISLDSSDLRNAILSVNTSVLNDTSLLTFSVEISAQTNSYIPLAITLNFNFTPVLAERLNILPATVEPINELYPILVDFKTSGKNEILTFTF